jgi:hypothetical protein
MRLHDIVDPTLIVCFTALFVCTAGVLVALAWWSLVTKPAASQHESGTAKKPASPYPARPGPFRAGTPDCVRESSTQEVSRP